LTEHVEYLDAGIDVMQ